MTGSSPKKTFSDENIRTIREQTIKGAGYGNPPEETRFKKGQSGNPKGRPKKSKTDVSLTDPSSVKAMILEESRRQVLVREGDKTFDISAMNAVIRAQYATALKGSPIAQKNILEQVDRSERENAAEIAQCNENWTAYKDYHWALIGAANENGEPDPDPLPHPDDIVIEDGVRPRFTGPFNEDEARKADETCRARDTLFMQFELDCRAFDWDAPGADDVRSRPSAALACAITHNNSLPVRLRLDDKQMDTMMYRFWRFRQRDLLKTLYRTWRSLGVRRPRGYISPPAGVAMDRIDIIKTMLVGNKQGDIDLAAMARGEPDDTGEAILANWPKK